MTEYEAAIHLQAGAEQRMALIMDKSREKLEEFCISVINSTDSKVLIARNYINAALAENDALKIILGDKTKNKS